MSQRLHTLPTSVGTRAGSRFVLVVALACLVGLGLRGAFQPADPPSHATVGIVWHDEGVWVHNARNRALFDQWRTDGWNPMFVSPVFTGIEWSVFKALGVGLSQARLPSILFSALSVLALAVGIRSVGTRSSAAIAACLAATNYIYVMYGRVALLEATMIGLMVVAWSAYAASRRRPALGFVAGALAVTSFCTKASAAFFVVGLGLDCCWALYRHLAARRSGAAENQDTTQEARAAAWTLTGLVVFSMAALLVFVIPNWSEYAFYNIKLYGQRRAASGLSVVITRASWFPIVHDFFTRTLALTWLSMAGLLAGLIDWKRRPAGDRLLSLWLALGVMELILQDTGNERRYVYLIPAMIGAASLTLGRDRRLLPEHVRELTLKQAWWLLPIAAFALYTGWGTLARLPFLYEPKPGARLAALLAVISLASGLAFWRRGVGRFLTTTWMPASAVAVAAVIVAGDLAQYTQWAAGRTYKNVEASREVGRLLPWGTPVLGKLANGLALENGIRPLYVGLHFGNYEDKALWAKVPYVLTYVAPRIGYEGETILEVLDASPGWRVTARFPVSESTGGHDLAALILKPIVPGAAGFRHPGENRGPRRGSRVGVVDRGPERYTAGFRRTPE